jgi:hypothetical protein
MREDRLSQAVSDGTEAKQLSENRLLVGAFQGLEDAYFAAWRNSGITEVMARETLFLAINVVGKVRDHLTAILTNGKLAEAEIKELVELAERKRRFGIR